MTDDPVRYIAPMYAGIFSDHREPEPHPLAEATKKIQKLEAELDLHRLRNSRLEDLFRACKAWRSAIDLRCSQPETHAMCLAIDAAVAADNDVPHPFRDLPKETP